MRLSVINSSDAMTNLKSILYVLMFFGLIVFQVVITSPVIVLMFIVCAGLMIARYGFGVKTELTKWAVHYLTAEDQRWQVMYKFLLNLAPNLSYSFGDEDETASSVIGRNLLITNGLEWRMIEFVLSWVLEGGEPHSVPAIED